MLRDDRYAAHQCKPIANWAQLDDRRLPHALLALTISELVVCPFKELAATPGIGPRKISSLLELLGRAVVDLPHERNASQSPCTMDTEAAKTISARVPNTRVLDDSRGNKPQFDETHVSNADWQRWQRTAAAHGLLDVTVGQVVSSLRDVPSVLWETPFGEFQGSTLDNLRGRKTYGDKRVRAIMPVFFDIHQQLPTTVPTGPMSIQLRPRFAIDIEAWLFPLYCRDASPTLEELRSNLVLPILNQVLSDGGEALHRVAWGRVGVEASPESVRRQAKVLGSSFRSRQKCSASRSKTQLSRLAFRKPAMLAVA
jgi:hypothetical protein